MADFRRFFTRGLATIMPTLITILLLIKIWEVLWEYLGQHIIYLLRVALWQYLKRTPDSLQPVALQRSLSALDLNKWYIQLLGVTLAILLVYVIGLFVGNLLGRSAWRLLESGVMRVPLIRAIYPAVKQVTDFLLAEHRPQFEGARVVAVRPHADNIWSVGLVTGPGLKAVADSIGSNMVTVFVPSSPTAFSGYVLVVPRENIIELPLTVEEAMRMLVTGGVSGPQDAGGPKLPEVRLPVQASNKVE